MQYFKVNEKCNGCLACVENCPANALRYFDASKKRKLFHNMTSCARCGNCARVCPNQAIEFQYLLENDQWDEFQSLDLIVCKVCGEPIFTNEYEANMSERLEKEPRTFCPKHREELTVIANTHFLSNKQRPGEKELK